MHEEIKISLILATYGRVDEVIAFCKSLDKQSSDLKQLELIVVDQNSHFLIKNYFNENKPIYRLKYIRVKEKGLSSARNVGIKNSNGKIIGYPDDDCLYYSDTIEKVLSEFNNHDIEKLIIGKIFDKVLNKNIIKNWPCKNENINYLNYYKFANSITIFHSRSLNLLFDIEMGAGKYYGSSEDLDFIYRCLCLNVPTQYINSVAVWHPEFDPKGVSLEKVRSYTRGFAYFVAKKHALSWPKWIHLSLLIQYKLYQLVVDLVMKKFVSKYFHYYFIGLNEGFKKNKCF